MSTYFSTRQKTTENIENKPNKSVEMDNEIIENKTLPILKSIFDKFFNLSFKYLYTMGEKEIAKLVI